MWLEKNPTGYNGLSTLISLRAKEVGINEEGRKVQKTPQIHRYN